MQVKRVKTRDLNEVIIIDRLEKLDIEIGENEKKTVIGVIEDANKQLAPLSFKMSGENGELKFYLVTIGKNQNSNKFETVVRHLAENTQAEFVIKSILLDESSLDFEGNIIIEKTGELARSNLKHQVLLLSEKASARTIPALEIEAEDVKASHNASVGKLDEDEMFYLESRGFSEEKSRKMLITAFLEEVIMKMPAEQQEKVRKKLSLELKL